MRSWQNLPPVRVEAGKWARAFGNAELLLGHLCDHMLTAPEAVSWAVLNDRYLQHCDMAVEDREQLAHKLWRQGTERDEAVEAHDLPKAAAALLKIYLDQVERAALEGEQIEWRWKRLDEKGRWSMQALGTSGVLVAWACCRNSFVITSYLGDTYYQSVEQGQRRWQCPLPREPESEEARGHLKASDDVNRYLVFSRSLQSVRYQNGAAYSPVGVGPPARRVEDFLPEAPRGMDEWENWRKDAGALNDAG